MILLIVALIAWNCSTLFIAYMGLKQNRALKSIADNSEFDFSTVPESYDVIGSTEGTRHND